MSTKDPEITISELKQELDMLRCKAKESDMAANKFRQECEQADAKIVELEYKVKFLEGQIEAYKTMCVAKWR